MKNIIFKLAVLFVFIFLTNKIILSAPINSFINDVTPAQNAINVNKSATIVIHFVQFMDFFNINSSNVKVYGSQTGLMNCDIVHSEISKRTFINPVNDFKIGEEISVTLTSDIETFSGTHITPFTFKFTVQALGGSGVFTEASIIDSVNLNTTIPGVEIKSGDIDGDNDIDLLTIGYFTGVKIYKNDGTGNFIFSEEINNLQGVEHYEELFIGDFDNDGELDFALSVATFTPFEDSLYNYKNDGTGHFTKTSSTVGGGLGSNTAAADLDGDGDLDLGMSWALDKVRYYINDGNGNFTTHSINNLGYFHTNGCSLGDIDNDGDIDIIVSLKDFDNIHCKFIILMNDGSANFSIGNTFFQNTYYDDQKLVDINGDNYLDLVGRNYHYFNLGNSTFFPTSFSGGVQAIPFDFNADGSIDLAYSNYPTNDVKFYENNGTGSFSFRSGIILGQYTTGGATGDFDLDGDIDLTINNVYGHTGSRSDISILLNNNCSHPDCIITGNNTIITGSTNNLYVASVPNGFWSLSNYGNTQASIATGAGSDSVRVNAGSVAGHFVLYYNGPDSCGGIVLLCSKHVFVDNPLPVELSSFNSIVNQRNVTLNWTTASEENNSGFEVQCSMFNVQLSMFNDQWSTKGFMQGHGTTNTPVNYSFEDRNLSTGKYKYRLKQIDFNGNFEYFDLMNEVVIGTPDKFFLSQNYPNPFNPATNIDYNIPNDGFVKLKIFDNTGREVAILVNEFREAGYYRVEFSGSNLPSGVYFYKLTTGKYSDVKRLVLLK